MKSKKPAKARKGAREKIKQAFSSQPGQPRQVAALPWRETAAGLEIMLVSSRDTGRWIIPKGWPMAGRSAAAAAAIEALEEAGLLGLVSPEPIGHYDYVKRFPRSAHKVRVEVFSLRVVRQRGDWPEKVQRNTQWFDAATAAELVSDADLANVINAFIKRPSA